MKIVFLSSSELEFMDEWYRDNVPRRGDMVEIYIGPKASVKKQFVVENVIWTNEGVVCHVE